MRNTIVIVGAGYSGTVLALNLLRRPSATPMNITLIERASSMHRGVAYAERDFPYLLNVPASRLSADPADPQQFLSFARTRLGQADAEDFLARSLYGDYLKDLLQRVEHEAAPHARLVRIHDEVLDLQHDAHGIEVQFARHPAIRADRVVLAVGNPPPSLPPWLENLRDHAAVCSNPWDLPKNLQPHHAVLIVGNGLTMADAVLALSADPQRIPTLHTISRRGLMPQPQTAFQPGVPCGNGEELLHQTHSLRSLLKAGRALVRRVESAGGDWREAITFVRNLAPQLWRQLPSAERARFVRHLQPHWNAHRHRMPPQQAERLAHLRTSGKLQINAGHVDRVAAEGDRLRVSWRGRGRTAHGAVAVDCIVNATGPDYALERSHEPLMQSLRVRGLIAADRLRLGIETDATGACVNSHGQRDERLFYLGPMLRASHWEATAVTELRGHAERLAHHLASS